MTRARVGTAVLVLLGICWVGARGSAAPAAFLSPQTAATPAFGEAELFATLKAAAEQGNPDAQFKLGGVYYAGTAVMKRDFAAAAKWFRLAAAQGHAGAQFCLASQLAAGEGVTRDYTEAAKWYGLAASQGDVSAQFRMGELLNEGRGVAQDHAAAATWFRKAAEHGDAGAQFSLGLLSSTGQGVKKDYVEARKWYGLSALQGNWGAQINLALLYSTGLGGTRDYPLAYMWFSVAALSSTGHDQEEALRARDDVAKALTPAQITDVTAKAKRCRESQFKNCGT
jgi:TPR repeat protein